MAISLPEGTAGPTSLKARPKGGYEISGNLDMTPEEDVNQLIQPYDNTQAPRQSSLGGIAAPEDVEETIQYPFAQSPPQQVPVVESVPSTQIPAAEYLQRVQSPRGDGTTPETRPTAETRSGTLSMAAVYPETTVTPEDLKGLSPAQVNQMIGQALNASQLEVQVLGLAGRDIGSERQNRRLVAEADRRARETAATALSAAKTKAAETIAQCNLTPEAQERLFQRLDGATTLEQARTELVEASKLSKLVASGEERDAFSRQQFGRTYGQLTGAEQAEINARVLREKANWTIQATDQGHLSY